MSYSIKKNWVAVVEAMATKPVIIMPFAIIAFLEALALEFLYFSTRRPLSLIATPIIRKFFGENFLHYPGDLILLPRLFYYKQVAIHVLIGAALIAASIAIFKDIRKGLPIAAREVAAKIFARYPSFMMYGIVNIASIVAAKRVDLFMFGKLARALTQRFPGIPGFAYDFGFTLLLFVTNLVLQALIMATLPFIVIQNKPFIKALAASIGFAIRNFSTLIALIFLPFLVYLPIALLKGGSVPLMDKTFPEITVWISALGIVIALFVDCFIFLCVSQLVMDQSHSSA